MESQPRGELLRWIEEQGQHAKPKPARFRGGVVPPASPYLCGLGLAKLASSTAACGSLC